MDAAAITTRISLARSRSRTKAAACGLAFDKPGGPLVAVCGLVGGSGASTLALCLARQAASESQAPILVTETATHCAGLAVIAGRATPRSLPAIAHQVAHGQAPQRTFIELAVGLRLIAALPSRATPAEPDELSALLAQARAAHGLVLVDCGSDWAAVAPTLEQATHILWTLPATPTGVTRARMLFAADALPRPGRARETMVAIALQPRSEARVRALRRLASERCERLVLVPHSEQIARGDVAGDERVERALTGLAASLRTRA